MPITNAIQEKTNSYSNASQPGVAANSLDAGQGTLLSDSVAGMVVAGATGIIAWVSVTTNIFAVDNFTVGRREVLYTPSASNQQSYFLPITGGTITLASQGSFFNITAAQVVNGALPSLTAGQVQLKKFISATRGVFTIVNR